MDVNELVNSDNCEKYYDRMTNSASKSTKGLIPSLVRGDKVLDVGCGSGVMLEMLRDKGINAKGIDNNKCAIDTCRSKGFDAELCDLAKLDIEEKFDTIIFSSVLHEIGSYSGENPFSTYVIRNVLEIAKRHLSDNGIIIIRDGLEADPIFNDEIRVKMTHKAADKFEEFLRVHPPIKYKVWRYNVRKEESYSVIKTEPRILKEFIFTYTWGDGSWYRESLEKFGYMNKSEWLHLMRCLDMRISFVSTSSEEYIKYASKFLTLNHYIEDLLEESTILLVAEKKEEEPEDICIGYFRRKIQL